jgi:hypothetical protein
MSETKLKSVPDTRKTRTGIIAVVLIAAILIPVTIFVIVPALEQETPADVPKITAPKPTLPGAPTGLTGTFTSSTSVVSLTWTAPSNTGGSPITGYKIYKDDISVSQSTTTGTTITLSTVPTVPVTFKVKSVNAIGESVLFSNDYVLNPTSTSQTVAPGAPTGLTGTFASSTGVLTLTWVSPVNNGGSPITGYKIYKDGNLLGQSTTTGTPITLPVVLPTSIAFKVKAVNAIGESILFSNEYVFTPTTVTPTPTPIPQAVAPGAPELIYITSAKTAIYDYLPSGAKVLVGYSYRVNLVWTAPSNNGGSPITGYQIFNGSNVLVTIVGNVLTTTISVSPSTSGTTFTFKARALNAIGLSIAFSNSLSITVTATVIAL